MDMTPILACERTKRSRDVATGKLPETLTITSGFVDGTVIGAVVAEQVHSRKPWRRLVFAAAASALVSVAGLALCLPMVTPESWRVSWRVRRRQFQARLALKKTPCKILLLGACNVQGLNTARDSGNHNLAPGCDCQISWFDIHDCIRLSTGRHIHRPDIGA